MHQSAARAIDGILDASIIGGFSRIGYAVRSRTRNWKELESSAFAGRTIVVTGATSGLGMATATILRSLDANVVLIGRQPSKLDDVVGRIQEVAANGTLKAVICDLSDLESVRTASTNIAALGSIDVLIHNAGSLSKARHISPQGFESTIATHVLGPFLMTTLLADRVTDSVMTVSSGGMYAAPLPDFASGRSLEMPESAYDGTRQYAIAKRAQVTLNEMWATGRADPHFYAMHPGWADTPGVQESLPTFRTLTKPLLRTSAQGADSILWLASLSPGDPSAPATGSFICDRQVRSIHKIGSTRKADTTSNRAALWDWCVDRVREFSSPIT
jgi:NAD(P)-dependent dehydrogenase (short-subunit alcohol dehydrogenase family)